MAASSFFSFSYLLFCILFCASLLRSTAVGALEVEPFQLNSSILEQSELFSMPYYVESLRNKRIVFMGDSVTRYQYIALIYSLSQGRYLQSSLCPNPVDEKTYSGWLEFFNTVSSSMEPIEYCDCLRFNVVTPDDVENRYWFDRSRNLSIIYIQNKNGEHIQGHWRGNGDLDQYRTPFRRNVKYFWRYDMPHALKWLIKFAFPSWTESYKSVLIFNVGHHPHRLDDHRLASKLYLCINSSKIDTFIWKTTTFNSDKPRFLFPVHDAHMCGFPNVHCFNTSWTYRVHNSTSSYVMWNSLHFTAPVYNRLNFELVQLFNKLNVSQ